MKWVVIGIGGVGGYVASVLCKNGEDVTLVARGGRKEALRHKGLVLHSAYMGEHVFHPAVTDDAAIIGMADIVFVCVKNYSLVEALRSVEPCIGEKTLVVPVMNGLDHAAVTAEILSRGIVVDSVMYITSSFNDDYSITESGGFARMGVSSKTAEAAETVRALLHHPGEMTCFIPEDMEAAAWSKYILNCAYNVITAYYKANIADLSQGRRLTEFRDLIDEAYAVAVADGVSLAADLPQSIYEKIMGPRNDKNSTSSMARDVMSGRRTEVETFSGYLVRLAHKLHVPVPVSERFYEALKHTGV